MNEFAYLRLGLWNIAESLYNSLSTGNISDELLSQIQSLYWCVAIDPENNCLLSPVVETPFHQTWLAASILSAKSEVHENEPDKSTSSKAESVKKEVNFKYALNLLSPAPIVSKELLHLYNQIIFADKIRTPVQCFSVHARSFLQESLSRYPTITSVVIQHLLCLWSHHFQETDKELQDVHQEVFKICLEMCEANEDIQYDFTPEMQHSLKVKQITLNGESPSECPITTFYTNFILLSLSDERNQRILDWLFPRLLKLADCGKIPMRLLYYTFVSRDRVHDFQNFLHAEDMMYNRLIDFKTALESEIILNVIDERGELNVKEIFLRIVLLKEHWIESVSASLSQNLNLINGDALHDRNHIVQKLLPLALLQYPQKLIGNITMYLNETRKFEEEESWSLLSQMVAVLERQNLLLEWNRLYSKGKILQSDEILDFSRKHSLLLVLHKITKLSQIEWSKIEEILTVEKGHGAQDTDTEVAWDITTFRGFCILTTAAEIVKASIEIDKIYYKISSLKVVEDEEVVMAKIQNLYTERVTEKLNLVKDLCSCLYPLTFRVEILENIFSMLFLCNEDIDEETSSLSGSEGCCDSKSGSLSQITRSLSSESSGRLQSNLELAANSSVLSHLGGKEARILSLPGLSSADISLQSKRRHSIKEFSNLNKRGSMSLDEDLQKNFTLEEQPPCDNVNLEFNKETIMEDKNLGDDNSSSFLRRSSGFVCNRFVARDILNCLKECVYDSSIVLVQSQVTEHINIISNGQVPSSISSDNLQKCLNNLSRCVSEANFRLELLMDTKFLKDVGKIPLVSQFSFMDSTDTDWVFLREETSSESDGEIAPKPENGIKVKKFKHVRGQSRETCQPFSDSGNSSSKPEHKVLPQRLSQVKLLSSLPSSVGIINLMLSSYSSLAINCLSKGSLEKAKLVLKINSMSDDSLNTEIKFTEALQKLKDRLNSPLTESRRTQNLMVTDNDSPSFQKPMDSQVQMLQSIKRAVSAGYESTVVTSDVEHFLSRTPPPKVKDVKNIMAEFHQFSNVLLSADNEHAVTTVDLALTQGQTRQQSVGLIALASHHCPSLQSDITPLGSVPGFVCFTRLMKTIFNMITNCEEETTEALKSVLRLSVSLMEILNSSLYPLSTKRLKEFLLMCNNLLVAVKEFSEDVSYDMENKISLKDSVDPHTIDVRTMHDAKCHKSFKKLVKLCNYSMFRIGKRQSTVSAQSMARVKPQYCQKFYSYLKLLSTSYLKKVPQNKDVINFGSFFSILHFDLANYFGKLIFDFGVSPVLLENQARLINHNLVYSVINNCCPKIPNGLNELHDTMKKLYNKNGQIVLNSFSEVPNIEIDNPEVLVRLLLSNLLKVIQEILGHRTSVDRTRALLLMKSPEVQNILSQTWKLSVVDVTLLARGNESLVFYLNLTNLLRIHSLLALEIFDRNDESQSFGLTSENPLERLMALNCVGYNVGQLGYISIHTLQNLLLGEEISIACYQRLKIFCNVFQAEQTDFSSSYSDPRILFSLIRSSDQTPKVQVFNPDDVDTQLENAMIEFLNRHTIFHSEDILKIPEILLIHLEVTNSNQEPESNAIIPSLANSAVKNYFTDVDLDKLYNNREKLAQLLEFLQDNTSGHMQTLVMQALSNMKDDLTKTELSVEIERPRHTLIIRLDYDSNVTKIDHKKTRTSERKSGWENCQLGEPIFKFLERHCWLLSVIVNKIHHQERQKSAGATYESLDLRTKCLEQLVNYDSSKELMVFFGGNTVVTALSADVDNEYFWDSLYGFVNSRMLSKCLKIINSLPDLFLFIDPKIQVLKDLILNELATQLPAQGCPNPWAHCQNISDANLQSNCLLRNMRHWPAAPCEHILQSLLGDHRNSLSTQMKSILNHKLSEVIVCDQILNVAQSSQIKIWHDVRSISESDPKLIFSNLIGKKKFQLCLQWTELFQIHKKCPELLDYKFLLMYFNPEQPDFQTIKQLLLSLEFEKTVKVCKDLIPYLKTLSSLRFLIEFLLNIFSKRLSAIDIFEYKNRLLGIQMLSFVPTSEHFYLWELLSQPHLILEQLLMNTRLEILENVMNSVRASLLELSPDASVSVNNIDAMLRKYATKALDIRISRVQVQYPPYSNEKKLLVSLASLSSVRDDFVMPSVVPQKSEWVADEEVAQCMCCWCVTFSMFNRRHHCRRCGRVVCSSCSRHKMMVTGYGKVPVRVCDNCYDQSHQKISQAVSEESLSNISFHSDYSAQADIGWKLTLEEDYNVTVREEFSYEHAPSVNLCLAILKLHSEQISYPRFLLESCQRMLYLLQPVIPGKVNPEVDYSLVIQMIKSLAIAAKVAFTRLGLNDEFGRCDEILNRADLLTVLTAGGKPGLASIGVGRHALQGLRDRLLSEELWPLALEVSTKCGFSQAGVWAAWGKACLRAGCWQEARKHFSHCLKAQARLPQNPPLLDEIVNIVEMIAHTENFELAGRNDVYASSVISTLDSLKAVTQGKYKLSTPLSDAVIIGPKLDSFFYEECIYYLNLYGSHSGVISFYLRHDDLPGALKYSLSQKIDAEVFLRVVYLPCLLDGMISTLYQNMTMIDKSLNAWKTFLGHVCSYLEKQGLLNVLYQLQVFMQDNVRAAMTCIHFYHAGARNYTDLANSLDHLHLAMSHLEQELSYAQWEMPSINLEERNEEDTTRLVMKLSPREIDRHISTIQRQIEVTKFLHECEIAQRPVMDTLSSLSGNINYVPTLFGNTADRINLAAVVILSGKNVEEGFGMAYRIIQGYHLKVSSVFNAVGRSLCICQRLGEIEQLVNCVKSSGTANTAQVCDEVILQSLQMLPEIAHMGQLDQLIRLISSTDNKISAYISCQQLKSAYLIAVKYGKADFVHRILSEAERLGQTVIQTICKKWLKQHSPSQSVTDSS